MSLEYTPTQRQLQQQHIERRLRIAAHAVRDRPINLKFKNGIIPESFPQEKLWASLEPWGEMPKVAPKSNLLTMPISLLSVILKAVSQEFGIPVNDLVSHRRNKRLTIPRHIAMYFAKEFTHRSFPEIGRKFGGRDHTTILHGVRKTVVRIKADVDLGRRVEAIRTILDQKIK